MNNLGRDTASLVDQMEGLEPRETASHYTGRSLVPPEVLDLLLPIQATDDHDGSQGFISESDTDRETISRDDMEPREVATALPSIAPHVSSGHVDSPQARQSERRQHCQAQQNNHQLNSPVTSPPYISGQPPGDEPHSNGVGYLSPDEVPEYNPEYYRIHYPQDMPEGERLHPHTPWTTSSAATVSERGEPSEMTIKMSQLQD